jgi:serine/threonine protein kinase
MLSGTVPFKANNMNDLHKLIIKGSFQYIKDISEGNKYLIIIDAQSLIVSLLEVEPKKRITIDQILCHPWVKSNDKSRSKMNLFTAAEKILLAKSNLDYRNANKDELIENFTLKNLDSLQETENQNINTKSIILAPFNSSFKANDSFLHRDVNIENDVLKLCGKVKELNRNYELNNNGEIDNGIIISPLGN